MNEPHCGGARDYSGGEEEGCGGKRDVGNMRDLSEPRHSLLASQRQEQAWLGNLPVSTL